MRETEREATAIADACTPSLDVVFDVLANQRRRFVLYHLHDSTDGIATIDEIAAYVASLEESDAEPAEHRLHVVTSLQHMHLPKLEDAGVVEYDQRSETVRYWRQPSLEEWLEHAFHKELS